MKKLLALLLILSMTLTLAGFEAAAPQPMVPVIPDAAWEAVRLINAERARNGLYALDPDETMMRIAAKRAEELAEDVSHLRPNKTNYDSIFYEFDAPCSTCNESILLGTDSAAKIAARWIDSTTNVLRTDVIQIGVGYYYDADSTYKHHWVILLGTPKGDLEKGDPFKVADALRLERKRIGLSSQIDPSLMAIASARAKELARSYDQLRPDGSNYQTILRQNGYSTFYSVQNIATGQKEVADVLASWLTISGPNENVLDRDITKLGVGYHYAAGRHFWVMLGAA